MKVILLREQDGRREYVHGAVLLHDNKPETEARIRAKIADAYRRVTGREDWNYDDVLEELAGLGLSLLDVGEFWEGEELSPAGGETSCGG